METWKELESLFFVGYYFRGQYHVDFFFFIELNFVSTREHRKPGISWRVGKGDHIDAWDCNWIPEPPEGERPTKPDICEEVKVQHFIKKRTVGCGKITDVVAG